MLQYLKEYSKYVETTGYRNVRFDKAEAFLKANRKQIKNDVDIQFFDAQLIATQEHLYFAVLNALQAFKNQTNHSKSPAMESMLYVSTQLQIQKAIERCGIKPQTDTIAIIIIGNDPEQIKDELGAVTKCLSSKPDESVLEMSKAKANKIKKTFEIADVELETLKNSNLQKILTDLVIERVALLSTQV